jgi:hypothetical protein
MPWCAQAHLVCDRAHTAELAKAESYSERQSEVFFMTKAPLSLVFAAGHTAYVFLLFICKRGNPKEG